MKWVLYAASVACFLFGIVAMIDSPAVFSFGFAVVAGKLDSLLLTKKG